MSEKELEDPDPVDPPENQGGGTEELAMNSPARSEADPPENQGGGSGGS